TLQRVASLVHEIGATSKFNRTHVENEERTKSFLIPHLNKGYDIIIIANTTEDEMKVQQEQFEIFHKKYGSLILSVNLSVSGGGQLIDELRTWNEAENRFRELYGNDPTYKEKTLLQLWEEGKTICMLLNAGKGTRCSSLTQSENNSRAAIKLAGKIEGQNATLLMLTYLQNAIFASSNKDEIDVFYVSQIYIPTRDLSIAEPSNTLFTKFGQEIGSEFELTHSRLRDLGRYRTDSQGNIIESIPKYGRMPTPDEFERDKIKFKEALSKGERFFYSLGSHRIKRALFMAFKKYFGDRINDATLKLEPPDFVKPLILIREGFSKINNFHINDFNQFLNAIPDSIKSELSKLNSSIEVFNFYIRYKDELPSLDRWIGLFGIGSEIYWWRYRTPFAILGNQLFMLQDLANEAIEFNEDNIILRPKGEGTLTHEIAEEARAMRALRGIEDTPIVNTYFGSEYVDKEGIIVSTGQKITAEIIKDGIFIGGVYVKGAIVIDSTILSGSRIINSVIDNFKGKIDSEYSFVESSTIGALISRKALVYNVCERNGLLADWKAYIDIFRPSINDPRYSKGQTRTIFGFEVNGDKTDNDERLAKELGFYSTFRQLRELPNLPSKNNELKRKIEQEIIEKLNVPGRSSSSIIVKSDINKVEKVINLMEELITIINSEYKEGLLRETISEIEAENSFIEGRIAYIGKKKGKLIVIGDIHGDIDAVRKILAQENIIERLRLNENIHVVFLGDYIDEGKDNLGTLELIFSLKKDYPDKITLLVGNHDLMQASYEEIKFESQKILNWLIEELQQYPLEIRQRFIDVHRQLFNILPIMAITPNGIVLAHSGVPALMAREIEINAGLLNLKTSSTLEPTSQDEKINLQWEIIWTFVNSKQEEENDRLHYRKSGEQSYIKYWVGRNSFEKFIKAIGGKILVRGHDSRAPWDLTIFGKRFITIISTGRQTNTSADYNKNIIARYGVFDLDREYRNIVPQEVIFMIQNTFSGGPFVPIVSSSDRSNNDVNNIIKKNISSMRGILNPDFSRDSYNVIIIATTSEDEKESCQREFELLLGDRIKQGRFYILSVNIPVSGGGQIIDTIRAYQKACDLARDKYGIDLNKLWQNKEVRICVLLNAGKGKRDSPLTQAENNSRGAIKMVGNEKGIPFTLITLTFLQNSIFASSNDGSYIDVFYTSQIYIPTKEIISQPSHYLFVKFGTNIESEEELTTASINELGIYEIDENGNIVRNLPKQVSFIDTITGKNSEQKAREWFKEIQKKCHKAVFSLGSHRIKKELFDIFIMYYGASLFDPSKKDTLKLEPPQFIQPLLWLLVDKKSKEEIITQLVSQGKNDEEKQQIEKTTKEVLEIYDKYLSNKSNLFGLYDIGSNIYWWKYRNPLALINNHLLMLAELVDSKIEIDKGGNVFYISLTDRIKNEARAMRDIRDLHHPIINSYIGGVYINNLGIRTDTKQEITFEDIKNGIEIGDIKLRASIIIDSVIRKGNIENSIVEESIIGEIDSVNSYIESSTVKSLKSEQALVYNIIDTNELCVIGTCWVDIFRKEISDISEGQTRFKVGFDIDGDKCDNILLSGNTFTFAHIRDNIKNIPSENEKLRRKILYRSLFEQNMISEPFKKLSEVIKGAYDRLMQISYILWAKGKQNIEEVPFVYDAKA
ncbi:MAG: serine/threonine protein phosphatase, partial [Candidatus Omnitrophica bacterium]|nr:serine/threonine protein phosphatase [Candidatus Omnitrophota bacterium]